ncbi:hypothetical protein EV44_g0544 [Erysiphe necator]|uniref:Gpi anchored serine-rich protein n=1 Tax=Uncinula necator TaxID=52586 RepID=A0A0B1PGP0_UNCNE|nr:hypothetical protein EV44_g0544 [Erysiphe necator]
MKGLLAPLITAVVLIDAATHNPIQYFDQAEPTPAPFLNVGPNNAPQADIYQNKPAQNQVVEPASPEAVASKPEVYEETEDIDEPDSDNEELDIKTTPTTEFINATKTPEPTKDSVVSPDIEDDGLHKPAGIDFPDGESAEKEFDHVEFKTTSNYTTSTVYTTLTSTVTDCVSTVTVCPEIGSIVTKTISLYTTICPVTTPTSVAPPSNKSDIPNSDAPESDAPDSKGPDSDIPDTGSADQELESDAKPDTEEGAEQDEDAEPDAEEGVEQNEDEDEDEDEDDDSNVPQPTQGPYLTKTIETTVWYTVTDCAPQETECPVGKETSSISTLTETFPVTDLPRYSSPHSTQNQPYVTSSPSSYPKPPHTNVTVPTTPPNFTINAGFSQKANALLIGFGLIAASVIALL